MKVHWIHDAYKLSHEFAICGCPWSHVPCACAQCTASRIHKCMDVCGYVCLYVLIETNLGIRIHILHVRIDHTHASRVSARCRTWCAICLPHSTLSARWNTMLPSWACENGRIQPIQIFPRGARLRIGPADCNHYNSNHMLFSDMYVYVCVYIYIYIYIYTHVVWFKNLFVVRYLVWLPFDVSTVHCLLHYFVLHRFYYLRLSILLLLDSTLNSRICFIDSTI